MNEATNDGAAEGDGENFVPDNLDNGGEGQHVPDENAAVDNEMANHDILPDSAQEASNIARDEVQNVAPISG